MNIIKVTGIKCYAYHGCLDEESKIGGNYIVDISIFTDFSEASINDDLSQTIDYVKVNKIVVKNMNIRSKLIESVAYRIIKDINATSSKIQKTEVCIKKLSPPINGNVDHVSVTIIQ